MASAEETTMPFESSQSIRIVGSPSSKRMKGMIGQPPVRFATADGAREINTPNYGNDVGKNGHLNDHKELNRYLNVDMERANVVISDYRTLKEIRCIGGREHDRYYSIRYVTLNDTWMCTSCHHNLGKNSFLDRRLVERKVLSLIRSYKMGLKRSELYDMAKCSDTIESDIVMIRDIANRCKKHEDYTISYITKIIIKECQEVSDKKFRHPRFHFDDMTDSDFDD